MDYAMGRLFNRHQDEEKRQTLRLNSTVAEELLWKQIRNRKVGGFKFRRQFSIDFCVADFYCPDCHLVIELDGSSHDSKDAIEYDLNRQHYFESLGLFVVRFTNRQVFSDLPYVLKTILEICEARQKPKS